MFLMNAKINMRQYDIFIEPRNFGTADINCFTVIKELQALEA